MLLAGTLSVRCWPILDVGVSVAALALKVTEPAANPFSLAIPL